MKCPTCGEHTTDAQWKPLFRNQALRLDGVPEPLEGPAAHNSDVYVSWIKCGNPACRELVIQATEGFDDDAVGFHVTAMYLMRPRYSHRPLDEAVKDPYRTDFQEAAAILDASPRMSTVLSRRILADLLEDYANLDDFRLVDRVDKFIGDPAHPHQLRENLHYLREIADLSAHTKKNDQAEIVAADRDEADWTLGVIERLFDYFIVGPERDRGFRERIAKKVADTGRKEIAPLPDAPKPSLPSDEDAA